MILIFKAADDKISSIPPSQKQKRNAAMNNKAFDFHKYKYGLFVHYVHGLSFFSDGRRPKDINETLDSFDARGFADDVASMGVQHVVLTAWHYNMITLYPSKVNEKYRGKPLARRDLLGEIIDGLNSKGIKVILYTHPRDGHDFDSADREATGWGEGYNTASSAKDKPDPNKFNGARWNEYIKELYTELADKYAKKLYGFYTDGVGPYDGRDPAMEKNLQVVDYLMLRRIMKSKNPELCMIQNYFGYIFSNDYAMPEGYFGFEGKALKSNVEALPAAEKSLAMSPFDGGWMPGLPLDNKDSDPHSAPIENAVKFVLFNASCTVGGGTVYATGPYCEGNIWQSGALDYLKAIGEKLREYKKSALDAKVSLSFPTISGDTLSSLGNKFFFTSEDEKYEYLHLTKETEQVILKESLDGAELHSPLSLTEGLRIEGFDGKLLRLSGDFDPIDSVIRFERRGTALSPRIQWINDTDKRIRYSADWKYHHLDQSPLRQEITKGCFESDLHRSLAKGANAFLAFEGSVAEIYGRGEVSVFIDGVKLCDVKSTAAQVSRSPVFTSPELYGGWHTLYLVTETEFDLDAVRIIN